MIWEVWGGQRLGVINAMSGLEDSNYKVGKRMYHMLWKGWVPSPIGLVHKT